MRYLHKYKFILFVCTIALIFQTGCADDLPVSTVVSDPTHDTLNTEMNFTQIQAGDYTSLLGNWTVIAYSDNQFDGTGQQWYTGGAGPRSQSLSVSADRIDYNTSAMIVQGDTLTDYLGESYLLTFSEYEGSLSADLADKITAINWAVTFIPKGVEYDLEPNNGVQIDNTKSRIVIWYSGMRVLTVFGRE